MRAKNGYFQDYLLGKETPYPIFVAELSANHQHSIEKALLMIEKAAESGADAVKIQTYRPETMTLDCKEKGFVLEDSIWKGQSLWGLYEKAHTPYHWHPQLFEKAQRVGIPLISTPFDATAVELLESLECCAYKIASFELCDHQLLKKVAHTGKPLIVSTGMSTLEEIHDAMQVLAKEKAKQVTVLHCVSAYPTPLSDAKLQHIPFLEKELDQYRCSMQVRIGLSDHTLGGESALVATLLGAKLIEKHFTLDRAEKGPDSTFSSEPHEFQKMIQDCIAAKQLAPEKLIMKNPQWMRDLQCQGDTENVCRSLRRSLFIVEPVKEGEVITEKSIRSLRPGMGLSPKYWDQVVGKRASRDLKWAKPLQKEDLIGFDEQDEYDE